MIQLLAAKKKRRSKKEAERLRYLIDVAGEAIVEILHVLALRLSCVHDGVDAGRRHIGVLSRVERHNSASARLVACRLAATAARSAVSRTSGSRDDEAVHGGRVCHVVRLRGRRALVGRLHLCAVCAATLLREFLVS